MNLGKTLRYVIHSFLMPVPIPAEHKIIADHFLGGCHSDVSGYRYRKSNWSMIFSADTKGKRLEAVRMSDKTWKVYTQDAEATRTYEATIEGNQVTARLTILDKAHGLDRSKP